MWPHLSLEKYNQKVVQDERYCEGLSDWKFVKKLTSVSSEI